MKKLKTKYGYFDQKGKEYVVTRHDTPRPWVNVICPNSYGIVVSQIGGGYSWEKHARYNRITNWSQDLLKDNNGKYVFIKDVDSGELWSLTWMPVKKPYQHYRCIHGIGYTRFENKTEDIESTMTLFVPPDDKLEIWNVKLKNSSAKKRNLKVISYMEWCLGAAESMAHRELHNLFIKSRATREKDILASKRVWSIGRQHELFFNHPWDYIAYHTGYPEPDEYLIDRRKFIGNYGDLREPEMNGYEPFGGTKEFNKWNESCGSLSWDITLDKGEEKTIEMLLGIEENRQAIRITKAKYLGNTEEYFSKTVKYWDSLLSKTYVETPDDGFNLLMNSWLKYQAISARLNGRTGYYQTGGAFGFRDQLQDSQIYFKILPEKAKERIKIHASRQYKDGAVQHWWHPISDFGLKNGISDNLLWLPYIVYRYIMETGDYGILEEKAAYIDGGEDDIRTHCEKAFERVWGRRSGRGLPLIGEGDWNDGLSAVGWQEKGESVWLGHFLVNLLNKWSRLESLLENDEKAKNYSENAQQLTEIINKYCWDGDWYIRATTDSGRVLGSRESESIKYVESLGDNKEGMIFLNAQTWAILAEVAPSERIKNIQDSLEKYLYRDYGPILFFHAYFNSDREIGYITRYGPGTRENGGLYSHAACWAIAAECDMKRPKYVKQLLKNFLPCNRSFDDPDKYCAEPYVLPGNVDGPDSPNFGRGGWTWYTGSAAWLFTVGWDWIIGIMPRPEGLRFSPCLPDDWPEIKGYRFFRGRKLNFVIKNTCADKIKISVNNRDIDGDIIHIENYKENEELDIVVSC